MTLFIYKKEECIRLVQLSEVSSVNFYNVNSATNVPISPAQIKPNGFIGVHPQSYASPKTDYFIGANQNLNGAQNPIQSTIDECLVRVAPKLYLNKYMTKEIITNAINQNPKITELLNSKGINAKVNMENIKGKAEEHFLTTYNMAKELSSKLPLDEYSALMQASLLHDIGKALIPTEILNKPGKLTDAEKEIVDMHSQLGAEILKTTKINPKVIEAVALHHTEHTNPRKTNNQIAQIISVADVYSALKEERPYKTKFSNEQVRDIMQNDTKLNQDYVNQIFYSEDISNFKQAV